MSYPRLTKSMPDETRPNPFHLLHKSLRFGHCRMLSELGGQDFGDDGSAGGLLLRLVRQLELYRAVAEARQGALLATLGGRGIDLSATTCQDHASHLAALAELQSLVRAVNVAAPRRRQLAGRNIYRCFALYAAADMARMDEDETTLLTALHHSLEDDDLRAIESRSLGGLAAEDVLDLARLLLPALSAAEIEAMAQLLQRHMAPEVSAAALAQLIRPRRSTGSSAAA